VFLLDAKESLSIRPQTVEEIGEVNKKHAKLSQKKPEVSTHLGAKNSKLPLPIGASKS